MMEIDDSYVQKVALGPCYESNDELTFDSFHEDTLSYFLNPLGGLYKMEVPIYWYNDEDKLQAYSELNDSLLTIFLLRTNTFEIPKEKCFRPLDLTLIKINGVSKIKIDSLEYFFIDGKLN